MNASLLHRPILGSRLLVWADEVACAQAAATLAAVPALCDAQLDLHGDLGTGKTTFARHLLRALGVQGRIKSPSYAVAERYELPAGGVAHHFDFYRFADPREWEEAGLREVFTAPGLKLVEWPEKVQGVLPAADLVLHLTALDEQRRDAQAHALSPRGLLLLEAWHAR